MPDVRVEDANGVERVLLGNLGTDDAPNYGLRVKSSDGATVIIDGTSDIFKISDSGTISCTSVANGANNAFVTGTSPTAMFIVGETHPISNEAKGLGVFFGEGFTGAGLPGVSYFVAAASGGAVTTRVVGLVELNFVENSLGGIGNRKYILYIYNATATIFTRIAAYYSLTQTSF